MAKKDDGVDEPITDTGDQNPTPQTGDVPEPEPEPEPKPDLPKEHQGKTPEQLVQELQGLQKKLGEQGKELGDVKSNFEYSQRLHELEKQKWEQAQVQPANKPDEPKPVDFSYENPIPGITEVVQRELQKERERQEKEQSDYQARLANANYLEGKSFMEENPKLYEGIKPTVEQAVSQAYQRGYITAADLNKKKTWDDAATLIHVRDKNFQRLQEATVTPVQSTTTELPTPAKPGEAETPFTGVDWNDRGIQEMMKPTTSGGDGLTREEVEEIIKKEQELALKGEQ